MKKIAFRFDIDTHKCIRDGVPNLLEVADKYNVKFSFFLNTGKAISFANSLRNALAIDNQKKSSNDQVQMMSARTKLGIFDYLYAALINPNLVKYRKQIIAIADSGCELGIHGGDNHELWQRNAKKWSDKEVSVQIENSLRRIRTIVPNYKPCGFASPAWNSPTNLSKILKNYGFLYYADRNILGECPISLDGAIPNIGVNLLGEPGKVAFWEHCRVVGMTDSEIIATIDKSVSENDITVIYDHPYYAGMKEVNCISKVIEHLLENDCEIVLVKQLM